MFLTARVGSLFGVSASSLLTKVHGLMIRFELEFKEPKSDYAKTSGT